VSPTPCTVPKLAGKTLAAAKKLLAKAGCSLGKVTKKPARKALRGKVVTQNPAAGKRVPHLGRVALVLGR
jgi:beta-lactam-binding protein with PASTA domain